MFIYPENLKAKPMLWLWLLRDIAVIGIGALLSVLALTQYRIRYRSGNTLTRLRVSRE